MKRILIYLAAMLFPIIVSGQESTPEKKYDHQMRFGIGGYPVTEWFMYSVSWCDCGPMPPSLNRIYWDSESPLYSTGPISAEFSWLFKDWFTFSLTTAVNVTWENSYDSINGRRTGVEVGALAYVVPQCRFNWLRRDLVKMYSSIGVGFLAGQDMYDEFLILPVGQISPVGIEVGRKVFGFCELGIGMLYTGAKAGIGFRF